FFDFESVYLATMIRSLLVVLLPGRPSSRPFPYTTLFRSQPVALAAWRRARRLRRARGADLPPPGNGGAVGAARGRAGCGKRSGRSEEHTSELQSRENLVCRLLLEKKKKKIDLYSR